MKLVNKTGYLKGTKTAKNPINIIPSNLITTQGMAFPIKANGKTLYPNTGQYKFPTSHVVETPLKQGGAKKTKTFNFTPSTSLSGDNTVNTQGREDAKSIKFNLQKTKDYNVAQTSGAVTGDKGAENKFYARYGEGSGKFKYDTDPKYAAQMDKNLKAAEKAKQPILREDVKLDPNAMFMLPTGLKDRKAAKEYQDFHKEIILNALPIPGVPKGLRQAKNIPKQIPVSNSKLFNLKNLFNSKSSNNKTQSGLDWMKDWYSDSDFSRRYSPTGQHPAIKMQPEILNRLNQYQPKNYIDLYKDKGLKDYINYSLNSGGLSYGTPKSIYLNRTVYPFNKKGLESTRAHELTHLIERNGSKLSTADEQALLKPFGISNINEIPKNPGFFGREILGNNPEYYLEPTEIHARMNSARYELGLTPKDKFTKEMFIKIDKKNNWDGMSKYIKNKKAFLDLMNNFWAAPPAVVVGAGTMQEKNNGAKTLKYKEGTKGVSLAFSRGEKDPKGGLTQKGVDKYNRATGGNLKMAVTTPPSKLKAGSKDANRRKSFCSRMKGMKSKLTSAKTANDPNSRINKSLRKWNCN